MYKCVYISENEYKEEEKVAKEQHQEKPIKDRVSCRIKIDITVQKNR